jgi:lipoprotein-anchoring transpeptidase ErfK/SrfK
VTAYKPHNPSNVRVDLSISKQQLYVMEGDHCLMAAACNVGLPEKPTPKGHFRIEEKILSKRSGAYGFSVSGDTITACDAGQCHGRYVGYPMPFWCGFEPGYGFHQGYVWPVPRTHGCVRLDKQVAPRFYQLVHEGTPVNVAETQPEDATVGRNVARPSDYRDPDPSPAYMIGSGPFQMPGASLLIEQ